MSRLHGTAFEERMRIFETSHDLRALPGIFLVARVDGRGFTRLTKDELPLARPFDPRFRDAMVATARRLMDCGFAVQLAYVQSDEISLLLRRDETAFGRKLRKLVSVLAGEASAAFTAALFERDLRTTGAFDARISQLPREDDVIDYFRWRQVDAHRNALGAHCYWTLRAEGASDAEATSRLEGASNADRNELLFARGTNFDSLPAWQKRGVALSWESYEKAATNPKTGAAVSATRRRLAVDDALPKQDAWARYVRERIG